MEPSALGQFLRLFASLFFCLVVRLLFITFVRLLRACQLDPRALGPKGPVGPTG